jgi:two-component system, chemotaxis family, sensor kinase CheA
VSDDIDEIWALYADDGAQSLDTVEAALLNLRRDAANRDAVAELFRAMHTFKGNSRLLGLETIEACAHSAEDMVGLVRDEGAELDPELLEMLLEASDRLREMMEMAVTTRRDVDDSISASITSRMKEKYERMKSLPLSGSAVEVAAPAEDTVEETADETTPEDEAPQAEETFETAVIFGGPTESLASDPVYLTHQSIIKATFS